MADEEAQSKDRKHRSPAYPFISLKKAVERAQTFYQAERRHAASLGAAARHWSYGEKSSGGVQTISALKQYGLLADEGTGVQRKVKLTERAFRILLDEVKDSPERAKMLKEAALAPKLFAEMFQKWGVDLPQDEMIRTFLRVEKRFNDDALNGAIKNYKDTLTFAKLTESDKLQELPEPQEDPDIDDQPETPMPQQVTAIAPHQPKPPQPPADGGLTLNVPYAKGSIAVQIRVNGESISARHLAAVGRYLKLAEADLIEWPDAELPEQTPRDDE